MVAISWKHLSCHHPSSTTTPPFLSFFLHVLILSLSLSSLSCVQMQLSSTDNSLTEHREGLASAPHSWFPPTRCWAFLKVTLLPVGTDRRVVRLWMGGFQLQLLSYASHDDGNVWFNQSVRLLCQNPRRHVAHGCGIMVTGGGFIGGVQHANTLDAPLWLTFTFSKM